MKPFCFVLMPFGRKTDPSGRFTDFDRVYGEVIKPAIIKAGLEPIRADEERVGGTIHKPMYERLILCDYAVADVTGANPNVYYELGIRHAVRPRSTVILFSDGTLLPFDIALLRGLPYQIDSSGAPLRPLEDAAAVERRLAAARQDHGDDSPLFQLVEGMPRHEISESKVSLFRERNEKAQALRADLAEARRADGRRSQADRQAAVNAIASDPSLGPVSDMEPGLAVDIFLSFRDVEAFDRMLSFADEMAGPLASTRIVQEQRGFALGRLKRYDEAAQALKALIAAQGPSGETSGMLGRIYKDQWQAAKIQGELSAGRYLKLAIEAYVAGFEADWRNPYPGVNAVTLMSMSEKADPRLAELLPVVRYAALQRARADGGYWDHATVMEVAAVAGDDEEAIEAAAAALACPGLQPWHIKSTLGNLMEIMAARARRGGDVQALKAIQSNLERKCDALAPAAAQA
jgi:hypothetical protein